MRKFIYRNLEHDIEITYFVHHNCVTVVDSYKIKDDVLKAELIIAVFDHARVLARTRSFNSVFLEIKAHNICYNHGWFKSRTKDSDLEYKQNPFIRFGYWLLCGLVKEK